MFFFLGRKHVWFGRAHLTDLRVDLDKFLMQALQFPEFSDFSFGLSGRGLVGQCFGNGFAIDLVGQAQIGAMAWVFGLMTMAARFATSACGRSDRATTQVAQGSDLIGNANPFLFEGLQGLWNRHRVGLLFLAYYIRTDCSRHKKDPANSLLSSRAPDLFLKHTSDLALGHNDHLLGQIFYSLNEDCQWHRQWSKALTQIAIEDTPTNPQVIQTWIDKWYSGAVRAVDAFSSIFEGKSGSPGTPPFHDLTSQIAAFSADYLRGVGLQPASVSAAN